MERKPRIYWFKGTKGRKDTLIFDAGHELGSIYIYKLEEVLLATELENQIKKYGFPLAWDITPSQDFP